MRKLLVLFFDLLYHQFAWTYDLVSSLVSLGQWKNWVLTPLPMLRHGPSLELGFGPGHLLKTARSEDRAMFGVDLSPQMARIAHRRLTRESEHPDISIGNTRNLPFPDGAFEQIVATFPSEYFFELDTLKEIHRALKPSGEIILVPMAWIRGNTVLHTLLRWVYKITGQSVEKGDSIFEAGKQVFDRVGFDVEISTIDFPHSEVLVLTGRKKKQS